MGIIFSESGRANQIKNSLDIFGIIIMWPESNTARLEIRSSRLYSTMRRQLMPVKAEVKLNRVTEVMKL